MKKDLFYTTATQALALVSLLLSFKLVSYTFSEEGFLLYSITRRNIALLVLAMNLGLSISLIKFTSIKKNSILERNQYLIAATIILLLTYLLIFIFIFLARLQLSQFFYADQEHSLMILSLYIGVGGLLAHGIVYSYFRGGLDIKNANLVDTTNHAVIPISGILLAHDINEVFLITGVLQLTLSLTIIGYILHKHHVKLNYHEIKKKGKELLIVGIVRVPAEAGMVALLSISAIFVTHFYGLRISGYFSFSLTLITTVSYFFLPIGIVLLPRISQQKQAGTQKKMMSIINKALATVLIGGGILTLLLTQFIKELFTLLSLDVTEENISIVSLTILSSVAYATYSVFKNIIDALYAKGVNSVNIFYTVSVYFAMIVYIVMLSKTDSIKNFLYVFDASLIFLGILSVNSAYKVFLKRHDKK